MYYGTKQLLAGNSEDGTLDPVYVYSSYSEDFTPFIDTETFKVYFASDRYGFGNYDLYRYNYVTYDLTMAASVLVLLPILVVYIFFQRWIISGLAIGGVKG